MQVFLEHNEERLKELAKRSGQDREKYLIGIINRESQIKNETRDYLQHLAKELLEAIKAYS